jgi:hypothetical protein
MRTARSAQLFEERPQNMQPMFPSIHNGGTTVNGFHAAASSFVMERGEGLLTCCPQLRLERLTLAPWAAEDGDFVR